ncbi:unannotated protein [freshwater metagenome]|uniref:Unannotated protein n=1 Tax=freshwater metagenome TaxID=449393 RepID=A0A6J7ELM9_9ZZZZ
MRYSCNVISRTLRSLAIAVPLSLAVGIPAASAGSPYPADVAAITILGCDADNVVLAIDGAVPASAVTGSVTFVKAGDDEVVGIDDTATGSSGVLGSATWSTNVPIPTGVTSIIVSLTANLVNGGVTLQEKTIDRADCDLPETGSNTAPIGKIALGATLGGALLAAVAIRRRPRKTSAAA